MSIPTLVLGKLFLYFTDKTSLKQRSQNLREIILQSQIPMGVRELSFVCIASLPTSYSDFFEISLLLSNCFSLIIRLVKLWCS